MSHLIFEQTGEFRLNNFEGDTMKLLAIMIEWADLPNQREGTYPKECFDSLLFMRKTISPGSVVDYFDEVSYGKMHITGNVVDWYNDGSYSYTCYYIENGVIPALDPIIDYTQYDGNHDGIVDGVIFIVAGTAIQDTGDPNDP